MLEEVGRVVLDASLVWFAEQRLRTYWVGAVQQLDVLAPIVVSFYLSPKSYRFAVHLASPGITKRQFPFQCDGNWDTDRPPTPNSTLFCALPLPNAGYFMHAFPTGQLDTLVPSTCEFSQ
jgi:hypothetical protein